MKLKESLKRKFPYLENASADIREHFDLVRFYRELDTYNKHKAKAKRLRQISRASRKRNRLAA